MRRETWCCATVRSYASPVGARGEGAVMHCPFCRNPDSRVVDSRETDEGQAIRRRRSCPECGRRFTTVETAVLAVVKRSGVTEPFSREKVIKGVRRACQGRQVDEDAYLRFASVYRSFSSADDFEREIEALRAHREVPTSG